MRHGTVDVHGQPGNFVLRFQFSREPTHVPVSFLSPSMASESLLFACPKRSNQEKGHPGRTPALRAGSLRAAGVLPTGHPWPAAKAARSLAPPRAARGPDPSALRRPTRAQRQKQRPKQRRWVPAFAGTTTLRVSSDSKLEISALASAARKAALCSYRVPSRPRRGRGGKSPQGRAHDARAFAVGTGTCRQRTSGASSRSRRGRKPRRPRPRGCVLFGYFLLHKHCAAGAARTAKPARRAEGRMPAVTESDSLAGMRGKLTGT